MSARLILLDTNVVSEPLKPGGGDPTVTAWLDDQALETLCLTTFTVAELMYGIAILPAGRRCDELLRRITEDVLPRFEGRVHPFDTAAAQANASLRAAGRPIPDTDSFIAAIAQARGLALATRNTRHFETTGLTLINPWAD
ncbi:MAG: type II toxin-antitoxin system VapC family toxin [Propionibacteriaceae bacterium]|jgi:predicted nucleic acid-binding protein|nr:type II toxin-antitoxin system VapC family toxin [Propionibacteriaceae bacterium]